MILITTIILAGSFANEQVPKLSDLSWLAGSWRGQMAGGKIEEVWTPAEGGVMMGMFRMVNAKGQAVFYEFQVIEETAQGANLKIKHFNRALKGQEAPEKFVHFILSKVTAEQAVFESDGADAHVTLRYRRLPQGRLEIDFHKTEKSTGKAEKMLFTFQKAP